MLSALTLDALAVALPISQSSTAEELAVIAPSRLKLCRAAAAESGGNHVAFGMRSRRLAVS
jgi:hypothetical protein